MNLFKLVKESITVKQAAALYGLPVTSTWMTRCPFHEDHTPSMKLNDTYYYCFGCGATGDVIDFTARLFDLRVYLKTPQRCSILPKSPICCVAFACIPWRSAALMRLASGAFWRISQHF